MIDVHTHDLAEYQAPEGAIWVCLACGKEAANRVLGGADNSASAGWDESCFLHAVLVEKATITRRNGRVAAVTLWKPPAKGAPT